jgi:hypothetical protein
MSQAELVHRYFRKLQRLPDTAIVITANTQWFSEEGDSEMVALLKKSCTWIHLDAPSIADCAFVLDAALGTGICDDNVYRRTLIDQIAPAVYKNSMGNLVQVDLDGQQLRHLLGSARPSRPTLEFVENEMRMRWKTTQLDYVIPAIRVSLENSGRTGLSEDVLAMYAHQPGYYPLLFHDNAAQLLSSSALPMAMQFQAYADHTALVTESMIVAKMTASLFGSNSSVALCELQDYYRAIFPYALYKRYPGVLLSNQQQADIGTCATDDTARATGYDAGLTTTCQTMSRHNHRICHMQSVYAILHLIMCDLDYFWTLSEHIYAGLMQWLSAVEPTHTALLNQLSRVQLKLDREALVVAKKPKKKRENSENDETTVGAAAVVPASAAAVLTADAAIAAAIAGNVSRAQLAMIRDYMPASLTQSMQLFKNRKLPYGDWYKCVRLTCYGKQLDESKPELHSTRIQRVLYFFYHQQH